MSTKTKVRAILASVATGAVIAATVTAPAANASPVTDYGDIYYSAVCDTIADYPTPNGVLGIGIALHEVDGWSYYDAGQIVAYSVYTYCPRWAPVLDRFRTVYGSSIGSDYAA